MANTKSAIKNIRKSERRRIHNQAIRSRTRTAVKRARQLIAAGQADEARQAVQAAYGALDKAAKKNIIHKNNAARRKARLMSLYNRTFAGK